MWYLRSKIEIPRKLRESEMRYSVMLTRDSSEYAALCVCGHVRVYIFSQGMYYHPDSNRVIPGEDMGKIRHDVRINVADSSLYSRDEGGTSQIPK